MYAIDIEFTEYFGRLTVERQLGTFSGDLALLGLTAATTLSHGEALKTTLAAVSTAVAGARTAVDKDILVSQTIQVLQSQMEASRLAIKNRILANLLLNTATYTLATGLSDLEDYYRAGTLAGALESLSAVVGNNSQINKNLTNGVTQNGVPVNVDTPTGARTIAPQVGMTSAGAPVPGVAPH
jgi:ABC-type phosphate transport system auxiliary subunit